MERKKGTVLIVEDRPNWRDLFQELLKRDFEIAVAESYEDALQILGEQSRPFHVAVVDIRLDDTNPSDEQGLALAAEIKKKHPSTQIIVVTAYPTVQTAKLALRGLEVFDYMEKAPREGRRFDHVQFCETIRQAAEKAEEQQNHFAFVLMPFAKEYEEIYEHIVKQTVEADGLACLRADDFFEARSIMEDIRRGIREAVYLIADLSGKNANVFYEVGIAHAEGKLPILLTQAIDDVPPRLRNLRCIVYEDSWEGAEKLQDDLSRAIQSYRRNDFSLSPLFAPIVAQPDPKLCVALLPPSESSDGIYQRLVEKTAHETGLNSVDVRQIFTLGNVTDAIWQKLNQATLIIADLSNRDPDVFYLTGICHGLDKDVVLLARSSDDIPFDLRNRSHVIYSDKNFGGLIAAVGKLKGIVQQILHEKSTKLASQQATIKEQNEPVLQNGRQDEGLTAIAADESLLRLAKAVCLVRVPKIVNGRPQQTITGTAWLITPNLALTCAHVIEARSAWDAPIAADDLERQTSNLLLLFDHTLPAKGVEYSLAGLEWRNEKLDYVLLRLTDRADSPLARRGFFALDADAPLTLQSRLLILQHPQGQIQQRASGVYERPAPTPGRILYTPTTAAGSSGAPVLNITNWGVIALHTGQSRTDPALREGVLLKTILADLKSQSPDLYQEIVNCRRHEE